jgi:hypothetical protein
MSAPGTGSAGERLAAQAAAYLAAQVRSGAAAAAEVELAADAFAAELAAFLEDRLPPLLAKAEQAGVTAEPILHDAAALLRLAADTLTAPPANLPGTPHGGGTC